MKGSLLCSTRVVCIESGAVNTLEGQVGVSLLIISLKTEMLERLAFCCDEKKEKDGYNETKKRKESQW